MLRCTVNYRKKGDIEDGNILAPSILSADFKILGEQIEQTEKAGAKYIHFDVMDGIFVPSISFGMPVLSALKGAVKQALDVHLMVTEPIRYVKEFANAERYHYCSLRGV